MAQLLATQIYPKILHQQLRHKKDLHHSTGSLGLPKWLGGKEPTCQCRRHNRPGFYPSVWKIPLEEGMTTHSSILAWKIP